jgi:DNA repair photolyase
MSDIIYIPKGKAREYSPYSLNIYNGCDHNCKYCYIKTMPFPKYKATDEIKPRKDILEKLEKQLKKQEITEQVLLCFMGDPYCQADIEHKTTREILKLLLKYDIPVAILSKGGERILRDLDLFKKFRNIKVGTTLTLTEEKESLYYEPGAALPRERIKVLGILHNEGIKTWVSFEPVIRPLTTYQLLELSYPFVDQYKVGKMNYYKLDFIVNWREFGDTIAKKLINIKKDFYIKKDLYKYMSMKLNDKYINQDYLTLRKPRIKIMPEETKVLQSTLF